jgi:anti-sigma factor RsiW
MSRSPKPAGSTSVEALERRFLEDDMAENCPELGVLAAFADGLLTSEEQHTIEAHLVKCARCLDIVSFAAQAKSAVPRPSVSESQKS